MIEIPFIYTTLYALELILQYENRRNINIDNLFEYRNKILKSILDEYNEGKDYYLLHEDFLEGDIDFLELDNEEELESLIKNYSDIFYLENNELKIYNHISLNDIRKMKNEFSILPTRFYNAILKKEIFELLGITKIYEFKEKIEKVGIELEKQIEKEYILNNNTLKLKKLLYKRFILLLNIMTNNKLYVEEYFNLPEDDTIIIDEEYDYYYESDYIKNNEPYPIDYNQYMKSEFYKESLDALNSIPQNLEDSFQYAIFGQKELSRNKYNTYLTSMYMSNIFESISEEKQISFETIDENNINEAEDTNIYVKNVDIENEEFAFYIIYIKKLNDLINQGYYELSKIKSRLLYLLDNIQYCLFEENNFNKFYESAINYETTEESFSFFENESKYFIKDVFEGKPVKTIEKLLFISTYYQLTKDKEIKEILNKYKHNINYKIYAEIILDNSNQKTLTKQP